MDERAGLGEPVSESDDFTVSQDTEFEEDALAALDDERPIDDSLVDEKPGVDEERRVDLGEEPSGTPAQDAG